MKLKTKLFSVFLITLFLFSCKDYNTIDSIPTNKYYTSEIMPDQYKNAYGKWRVIGTSGGYTGEGYEKDFDYLILKEKGIFGILRNDSLIAYGKLVLTQIQGSIVCKFNPEKSANIELCVDPEKEIKVFNNDTLYLFGPCCDRFNIHLVRVK